MVLTYIGHRRSQSGEEVYCFTAKKKDLTIPVSSGVEEKPTLESLADLDLTRPLPDCRIRHTMLVTGQVSRSEVYLKGPIYEGLLKDTLNTPFPLPKGERIE